MRLDHAKVDKITASSEAVKQLATATPAPSVEDASAGQKTDAGKKPDGAAEN